MKKEMKHNKTERKNRSKNLLLIIAIFFTIALSITFIIAPSLVENYVSQTLTFAGFQHNATEGNHKIFKCHIQYNN